MVETSSIRYLLPPNRALLIAPGQPHPARTLGQARIRTIFFHPEVVIARPLGLLEVRPLFRELIAEACNIGPLFGSNQLHSSMTILLAEEVNRAPAFHASIQMPKTDWLYRWAVSFLDSPSIGIPSGYSRRTIERKLLAETLLTLGQWCRQARMIRGLQALADGESVDESAISAGFATTSAFIFSFRKQFGTTPGRASIGPNH